MAMQAWDISEAKCVGGWAEHDNAVSDPAGKQIRLQIQRDRAGRHAVVARPRLLPPRHRIRCARRPTPERLLSLPQTLPRSPHFARYAS